MPTKLLRSAKFFAGLAAATLASTTFADGEPEPGAVAQDLRWDNDAGDYRLANGSNWYVDKSEPKIRETPDSLDTCYYESKYSALLEGDTLNASNFIASIWGGAACFDITNGTMNVGSELTIGRWGGGCVANMYDGVIETKKLVVSQAGAYDNCRLNVYGGHITATGGSWPGALGVCVQGNGRGEMYIYGGVVTANNTVQVGFADNLDDHGGPSEETASKLVVNGGELNVTAGSIHVADSNNGRSAGRLIVSSGTITNAGDLNITASSNGWGQVDITGGSVTISGTTRVGNHNYVQHAALNVSGGVVNNSSTMIVANNTSSTGSVLMEGGVVKSGGLNIGAAGGAVGRVTMTGGSWTNDVNYVNIGAAANGNGYLTVSGGEFYTPKRIRIGSGGVGRFTIENHGTVIDGSSVDENYVCFGGPDSVLRLNAGGKIYLRSILRDNDANGTVEFNGGEMIKTVEGGAYSWAGVGSTAIDDNHTIKILAGGMIFNSDYLSTFKGSILCPEGCGGITKRGAGELNLNTDGARSFEFSGPIYVEGGTLRFSGNAQLPDFVDVIRVSQGATLVIPKNVTCRVLENNGTIQGGTVTVEADAATKVATKAVWTGAMEDGDVYNSKNYIVYDQNGRVMYEQTITVDMSVIVPYQLGAVFPSFDGFADVSWAIEEDICSEGYSRPAVLKTAVAWYDPSDTGSLITNENGQVTEIGNKGTAGALLDLQNLAGNMAASGLSADGFNGRQSVLFANSSGYKSKNHFSSDFPANGPRTLFVVAKGDTGKMTMLSIAQYSGEEGRSWLLAHGDDWGRSYQVSYSDDSGTSWSSWKVGLGAVVNQRAYVFSGRTAFKEGVDDGRIITSAAWDGQGNQLGNTDDSHLMPKGSDNLNLYTYYGMFENGGYNAHSDGYQGEALIFTNALSDAEMDEVNTYLKAKWLDSAPAMPDRLVVNAQVDLDWATRTFETLSGRGSFVDGTVVVNGDVVVTVNADRSVVAPSFDKLVLGENARLIVKGAKNLLTKGTTNILAFNSLEGRFASVVGDDGTKITCAYEEGHVSAKREMGIIFLVR